MNFLSPKLLEKHAKNKFKNILPFSRIFCCLINRSYLKSPKYNWVKLIFVKLTLECQPAFESCFRYANQAMRGDWWNSLNYGWETERTSSITIQDAHKECLKINVFQWPRSNGMETLTPGTTKKNRLTCSIPDRVAS